MRRAIIVLSSIIILIMAATTYAAVCGDVNGDTSVNVGDVVFLINYVFKLAPAPNPLGTGDVNADGHVNVGDAVYLINYIFKLSSTPFCGTVTDIDGNTYPAVKIGNQWWMKENLKVTHYRNGDSIPNVTDGTAWNNLTTGAYCNYNNDINNVTTYGRLYNWYAVTDSRVIAPAGWHVASDAEWKQLEMTLGMSQAQADSGTYRGTTEGGKLKEAGTTHWITPNTGATNESGFSALPGGCRIYGDGYDYDMGFNAYFWSSTKNGSDSAWWRGLSCSGSQVSRYGSGQGYGFSVRCVRDSL